MQSATATETLRRVPLFSGLSVEQLEWISGKGTEIRLAPSALIASQGDPADGFYVILEGETEWTRRVGGREFHAVTLRAGEVFAELILFLEASYPTTGRALTEVRLFKLEPDAFWEMLAICPQVLRGVLRVATERSQIHESVSQQQARLISLGNMAAGLAHELNNPAAAVRRSAAQAREVFPSLSARAFELSAQLSPEQRSYVASLPKEVAGLAEEAPELDTLARSDRVDEISDWLDERGVEDAWELAPTFVGAVLNAEWLQDLADRVPAGSLGTVLSWLAMEVTGDGLLEEIEEGSGRIFELVGAVKEYSYMDRAPSREEVDVHEGLENTLAMLGHKLEKGNVAVTREYDPDLPRIAAYGDELNQVWTALIDNAIDAAGEAAGDESGHVRLRTSRENGRVLVEVSDDGPGIPEEIEDRVFEPFFTTKEVGAGVGLGLDIARRAVGGHGGEIRAVSEPGDTRIEVRLPVEAT
ncbi:MAG: hypothetical protein AVDCRST_MAG78-2628 [uncultured Rubrobacteraceae bacterium]|uniref:histidine kinase n=1 Tax=uncultured Rubrobacteraceae bacterium TaxID=349277 RepID=A0A6J4QPW2_9ACTN|nr:MAG: hypothetical protein AVDCRST_MAG78-2628 [uncultured Rubrobacteraceae bacterium]